jgi:hypothetical protein
MQPSAHIQAAIEACQLIFDNKHIPADRLINSYLKERRYIGSKDKQAINANSGLKSRHTIH